MAPLYWVCTVGAWQASLLGFPHLVLWERRLGCAWFLWHCEVPTWLPSVPVPSKVEAFSFLTLPCDTALGQGHLQRGTPERNMPVGWLLLPPGPVCSGCSWASRSPSPPEGLQDRDNR